MFGFFLQSGRQRPDFFCLALTVCMTAAAPLQVQALEHRFPASSPAVTATAAPEAALPKIALQIRGRRVIAEVAADDATRAQGLMFRKSLDPDHGMLFVFPQAAQLCFWMKNTPLPLTVAFIDTEGRIVSLADMQPHSLDSHCAIAPANYALEMEQGWFLRHDAGPGTQVEGLPRFRKRAPK